MFTKCPYRKVTVTKDNRTEKHFGECYREECPYFLPKSPCGPREDQCDKYLIERNEY